MNKSHNGSQQLNKGDREQLQFVSTGYDSMDPYLMNNNKSRSSSHDKKLRITSTKSIKNFAA